MGFLPEWKSLFPNHVSFVCFVSYIALFVAQGLLITSTKNNDSQGELLDYSVPMAVMMSEVGKLLISTSQAVVKESPVKLAKDLWRNRFLLVYYLVPSGLYCMYNNLTYHNLVRMDPTTYFLLLQFRVVVTGVLFQLIFRTKLSKVQWLSLFVLTFGCIMKESENIGTSGKNAKLMGSSARALPIILALLLIQVFASSLAGVYNEYLLKNAKLPVYKQNIFMYFNSVLCNCFMIPVMMPGRGDKEQLGRQILNCFRLVVLCTIVDNILIGIVTSYFLKHLNVILKAFASALELAFTAVLSFLIFGIPITLTTMASIVIVSVALYFYAMDPIKHKTESAQPSR